ncbi:MAG TPA: carbamate kinase [Conexivisphaerales archaeon]|nr:carbamate kinase [Conexivisphaerales archaeon]
MTSEKGIAVIALGGNALLQRGQQRTFEAQYENVKKTAVPIADLIEAGYKVVVTHGNGPQVGDDLLRQDAGSKLYQLPPYPMDACGAETQGLIGYMIQQGLRNELKKRGIEKTAVTVVTRMIVDGDDKAFKNPSKPVGPFYAEEEGKKLASLHPDFVYKEDAGRGWRRVVPSPDPKIIAERSAIKTLVEAGFVVIASGGGGIPVVEDGTQARGVEAVIDKDLGGQKLASLIGAEKFVILTDVDAACINFGTPQQRKLGTVPLPEMRKLYDEGYFLPGSMGPKVLACMRFVEAGGDEAIIAELNKLKLAVEGKSGTHIVK